MHKTLMIPRAAFGGMTANERRLGRFIRDGEGHPGAPAGFDPNPGSGAQGGGDQGQNNQPGNSGVGESGDSSQHNSGQSFDPAAFWQDPSNDGGASQQNQQQPGTQPTDQVDPNAEFGQQLLQEIGNYQPPAVFDNEISTQIAEGNLDGINQRMASHAQHVMRQSMVFMSKIMQRMESQMDDRINSIVQSNSTQQSDTQLLTKEFPTYERPEMRPVITGVFQQSLKHTKGDRPKAVAMTRDMLKSMGQLGGFGTPPSNPDDSPSNNTNSESLVQQLLKMG